MADLVPPAPTPEPKRVRSLPDWPANPRPASSGIRSLPNRASSATRLPGADAASYGGDMNWRRGIAVLWALFGLIAFCETFLLGVYLMAGGAHWPGVTDVLRLTILCGVFLSLWIGWSWTRWVLVGVAFFAGARTILLILVTDNHGAGAEHLTSAEVLGSLIYTGILALLAILYLVLCVYLSFSADVLAFTKHRREEGRRWMMVPVALVLGSFWLTMLGSDFALRRWLENTLPAMQQLAQIDVQAMAAGWNPSSLETVLDVDALRNWSSAGREEFMRTVRLIGTFLVHSDESARSVFYYDSTKGTFMIQGKCRETARCSDGHATFFFSMTRPLTGPWRVTQLGVGEIDFYRSPMPATPTATPAPSAAN